MYRSSACWAFFLVNRVIKMSDISETNSSQKVSKRGNDVDSDRDKEVIEQENITLLEERLAVQRSRRKVGEVLVRKVIETRLVEVPVRREKLIVEQVGAEAKQLAEIDLGQGEVTGVELAKIDRAETGYTVKGEFVSPQAARDILDAIVLQENHGCLKIRLELVVENQQLQETYQRMLDFQEP